MTISRNLNTRVVNEKIQGSSFTQQGIEHVVNILFFADISLDEKIAPSVLLYLITTPYNL
jgi:hypothetical protein